MKVSTFDFNHARSLHYLLEEAHVGRAAAHLGITPAAASNALRRLREEFGDPLLVKKGRGLVRTRMGDELRVAARTVVESTQRLLGAANPFDLATYRGELPIAMSEHVAALLLPALDRLVREAAPGATLVIASIPVTVGEWLERTAGVLVSPTGAFAATSADDHVVCEPFYEDRYVCVMRRGHPVTSQQWNAKTYAAQGHVLVTPRGRSLRSDVDEQLDAQGLARRIARVVPSFTLALPLVAGSDLLTTVPERCVGRMPVSEFTIREVPLTLRPLAMTLVVHPAHASDARTAFIKAVLRTALQSTHARSTVARNDPRA